MRQPLRSLVLIGTGIASLAMLPAVGTNTGVVQRAAPVLGSDADLVERARLSIEEGKKTFRFDTFGDEVFWGDTIKLHEAIAGEANGGVGPGLSPSLALQLGLKVDSDALPASLKNDIRRGRVDLEDPASTLALLRLNAVVGVTGLFENGQLASVGIQCALCHSTVDDSFVPGMAGIGRRLDGWANRDLDIGQIVNFAPDLAAVNALLGTTDEQTREVLTSWGPGKFDAELFLDGQNSPTLIPPAFGLKGMNLHTWTGWGSVTHWNAFVANLEMHGVGRFWRTASASTDTRECSTRRPRSSCCCRPSKPCPPATAGSRARPPRDGGRR